MSRIVGCPSCQKPITVTADLYGRTMACPHCSEHFTIPDETTNAIKVAKPVSSLNRDLGRIRFTFSCMRCSSILEGRGDLCGQRGRCPTCGAIFVIPRVDPATGLALDAAIVAADGQLPTPMHAYATAGTKAPKIIQLNDDELAIICPRCNRNCSIESNACENCGTPFTIEGAEATAKRADGSNGFATAAMAIAIISFCIPFSGVVGVALGLAGMKRADELGTARPGYGLALAAVIVGLISVVAHIASFVF